jgi:16S rRNA G1207 methylase RsmC
METAEYLDSLRQDIVFTETLRDFPLTFHSTWGIFSPRRIDDGTRLLIEYMKINPSDRCIDFGCGYGPIGLAMAKLAPEGDVLMLDKDFVAVEFANRNAVMNDLSNARAILSNGFDAVLPRNGWNVIASNVPAKVGKEMLMLNLHDAFGLLEPGGHLYVVTINGLRQFMKRHLKEVFGNYKKLKQGSQYTLALAVRD